MDTIVDAKTGKQWNIDEYIEKLLADNKTLSDAIDLALNALARHLCEQRADDENTPICIHITETYNLLANEV